MNRASPADLRKCLETANMLLHTAGSGLFQFPLSLMLNLQQLSAIFADKIESLAAEAEMEENQQNN